MNSYFAMSGCQRIEHREHMRQRLKAGNPRVRPQFQAFAGEFAVIRADIEDGVREIPLILEISQRDWNFRYAQPPGEPAANRGANAFQH
jgi:hypothetical protein